MRDQFGAVTVELIQNDPVEDVDFHENFDPFKKLGRRVL